MDKKEALIILINSSYILDDDSKNKILAVIDKMSDDQIVEWGKMLSQEQIFVEENKEEIFAKINSL
ncbi:MAG: hypothetical protein WAV41_02625 [Microgenomates group bacterium]